MEQILQIFTPSIAMVLAGIAAVIVLGASQLILADEGEYHLGSITYQFQQSDFKQAFISGVFLSWVVLYFISRVLYGTANLHWLPITIVALVSAQAIIDIKYHELSNEWTFAIGLLGLIWRMMDGGLPPETLLYSLSLFGFFYISWFFFNSPGYGDVKLAFVAGIFITSWVGLYQYFMTVILFALFSELVHQLTSKNKGSEFMKAKFAFGPYLLYPLLFTLIGMY